LYFKILLGVWKIASLTYFVCSVTENALSVVLGKVGSGFLSHTRFAAVSRVQQPLVFDGAVDQGWARLCLAHYCLLSGTLKIPHIGFTTKLTGETFWKNV
jgi:hypothetical protein